MKSLPNVLVVCSHGDSGGAPSVATILANNLSSRFHFSFAFGSSGQSFDSARLCSSRTPLLLRSLSSDSFSLLGLIISVFRIISIVEADNIDIIHCHSFVASLACRLAGLFSSTPVIYTVHGWPWRGLSLPKTLATILLEFFASLLSYFGRQHIVYVSNHTRLHDPFVILRRHSSVIYNSSKLESRSSSSFVTSDPGACFASPVKSFFLVPARFAHAKGHKLLFESLSLITSELDSKIVLCGEDTMSPVLINMAQKLCPNLFSSLLFLGEAANLESLFKQSTAIILPSLYEAFPLALLDAMYQSKPIIATRVGGVPEMLLPFSEALLVAPNSPSQLARSIIFLDRTPSYRDFLASQGKRAYLSRFTQSIFVSSYSSIYESF